MGKRNDDDNMRANCELSYCDMFNNFQQMEMSTFVAEEYQFEQFFTSVNSPHYIIV